MNISTAVIIFCLFNTAVLILSSGAILLLDWVMKYAWSMPCSISSRASYLAAHPERNNKYNDHTKHMYPQQSRDRKLGQTVYAGQKKTSWDRLASGSNIKKGNDYTKSTGTLMQFLSITKLYFFTKFYWVQWHTVSLSLRSAEGQSHLTIIPYLHREIPAHYFGMSLCWL